MLKDKNKTIEGKCVCGEVYVIHRNPEIPKYATSILWNWCPKCEGKNGNCEWEEEYGYEKKRKPKINNQPNGNGFLK